MRVESEVLTSFHTLKDKYGELVTSFDTWTEKQSPPIKVAVSSTIDGVQGAFMWILAHKMHQAGFGSRAVSLADWPWVQARNCAVVTGVSSGILSIMKDIRGKPDLMSFVLAGSAAGSTLSWLAQGAEMHSWLEEGLSRQPNNNELACCLGFAALYGIGFKLIEKHIQPTSTTPGYTHSRTLLLKLGLERFEKNFKDGLLTDSALPYLTDESLKEVGIPPGARLRILDYIQRDPEIEN